MVELSGGGQSFSDGNDIGDRKTNRESQIGLPRFRTTKELVGLLFDRCSPALQVGVTHRAVKVHSRLGNPFETIEVERLSLTILVPVLPLFPTTV